MYASFETLTVLIEITKKNNFNSILVIKKKIFLFLITKIKIKKFLKKNLKFNFNLIKLYKYDEK